jgi:hypothetical protein
MGKVIILAEEIEETKCELCQRVAELRPYGPNAMNVCFSCAMEDEPNAIRMFERRIKGDA